MNKAINSKKWSLIVLISTTILLCMIAVIVIIIDPFLHYHAPILNLQYPLKDERYNNDGIARHYDYEAIIAGSSTSQNFKASQFESLFGTKTIKQTFAGGSYHEISEGISRALSYNPNVKYVLWGLDLTRINAEVDATDYDGIPDYLYDNNIFNDVSYLFNVDVLKKCVNVINYTRSGQKTTTMDDYAAWYPWATYGRDRVLSGLIDYSNYNETFFLGEDDVVRITDNCNENIIKIAKENPEVTFLLFYTPSSAVFWYGMKMTKQLDAQIEAEKIFTSLLLEQPNIVLFDFSNRTDLTTDLDLYMDTLHYSPIIGDEIMKLMSEDKGRLTKENYEAYFSDVWETYQNMDYDYE